MSTFALQHRSKIAVLFTLLLPALTGCGLNGGFVAAQPQLPTITDADGSNWDFLTDSTLWTAAPPIALPVDFGVAYHFSDEPVTITNIALALPDEIINLATEIGATEGLPELQITDEGMVETEAGDIEVVPDVLADQPNTAVEGQEAADAAEQVTLAVVDESGAVATPVIELADGFQGIGISWPLSEQPPEIQIRIRDDETGEWSDWLPVTDSDEGPDPETLPPGYEPRAAAEDMFFPGSDAVQIASVGQANDATLTTDVRLALIAVPEPIAIPVTDTVENTDAVYQPESDLVEIVQGNYRPGFATNTQAALTKSDIVTRLEWGAQASCYLGNAPKLQAAVVHHTAGTNTYSTKAEAMQRIRSYQAYHISLDWCDIGYNFLVDKWGTIYEGSEGSWENAKIGAHAKNFNTGTVGVSIDGNYSALLPSEAAITAVGRIIGYKFGVAGIDPLKTVAFNNGTSARTMPAVVAHRDVGSTECPGNAAYGRMNAIRSAAAANYLPITGSPNTPNTPTNPTTPTTPVAPTVPPLAKATTAQSVVQALYKDLLGRGVDPSGYATWPAYLTQTGSQSKLVQTLTVSQEYATLRATQAYQNVLHRQPEPAGLKYWVDSITSGRIPVDDVAFTFYLSVEFYQQGGGTDDGYVRHMYKVMLDREPTQTELTSWVAKIRTVGRDAATRGVWFSTEAARRRAAVYYNTYLGRKPDEGGLANWANILLKQGEGAVRTGILGSEEYKNLAIKRYPDTVKFS